MSTQIRKRIGEFSILLIYLIIDVFDIWPRSHFWALSTVVIGIIALMLLDGKFSYKLIASVGGVACLITGAIYLIAGPAIEESTVGWLQPANDPTPPNVCDDMAKSPILKDAMIVLFADNGALVTPMGGAETTLLQLGECRALSMQKGPNGVQISAQLFDVDGRDVGNVDRNRFKVFREGIIAERTGDLATLVVHNENGNELLFVRYLNPRAIKVRGTFSCPKSRTKTITIEDKQIVQKPGIHRFCTGPAKYAFYFP